MATQYLNPSEIGDYTNMGLSSGTATDKFVYTAGLAMDPKTFKRRADAVSIADETRICLENVKIVLAEVGLTLKDIVKTTCYVREDSYRKEFREAYTEIFGAGPYPARCTFVLGIASDLRVQIEVIAARPQG